MVQEMKSDFLAAFTQLSTASLTSSDPPTQATPTQATPTQEQLRQQQRQLDDLTEAVASIKVSVVPVTYFT